MFDADTMGSWCSGMCSNHYEYDDNTFNVRKFRLRPFRERMTQNHNVIDLEAPLSMIEGEGESTEISPSPVYVPADAMNVIMLSFTVRRGAKTQNFIEDISDKLLVIPQFVHHVLQKDVYHTESSEDCQIRFIFDAFPSPLCIELLEDEDRVSNIRIAQYALKEQSDGLNTERRRVVEVGGLQYRRTSFTRI